MRVTQLDRALSLARQMRARGVRGNVFSYSALLNVCVKCGQLDAGLEVWGEMERNGVPLNVRSNLPHHLPMVIKLWHRMVVSVFCTRNYAFSRKTRSKSSCELEWSVPGECQGSACCRCCRRC